MANKVTNEDIKKFNVLRHIEGYTYAEIARQTGFSASTVRKYIKDDYEPPVEFTPKTLQDIPKEPDFTMFKGKEKWNDLCTLTDEEKEEMKELWKEMEV